MPVFDQRHQKVTYQYNVHGTLNFGTVQSQADAVAELEKLRTELQQAIQASVFDEDAATDVDYQLTKAVQQAKKPQPDRSRIVDHLNKAKDIVLQVAATVTAAGGLVTAFNQAIEVVQKLF